MAATGLKLARDLTLPTSVFTQVVALLAKRGAGKTHTAAVVVEEMVAAGGQVVVLDPVGAWWGLRAGATGKDPGLPFVVLGGDHADLPLQPASGAAIADLVVAEQLLLVVDMSAFDSKAEQNRFVLDFTTRLYHRNRDPLHLVLEEADEFAPERGLPGDAPMLGAVQRVVRRGRSRGIGVTLISQRSASVSKGVLTQADVLITLRTTAPHDQRAIGEWIRAKGVEDRRDEVLNTLSALPTGTAWVWAPELDILQKTHIRARRTFDSSATPQLGHAITQPAVFAPVDLAVLRKRLTQHAETPQDEKADSLQLQQRNRELAGKLARVQAELVELRAAPPRTELVPVLDPDLQAAVLDAAENLTKVVQGLRSAVEGAGKTSVPPSITTRDRRPLPAPIGPQQKPARSPAANESGLPKAQRLILAALAPYRPRPRSKSQIALLTGYAARGGGFNNALGALRSAGYISGVGDNISVTDAGAAALGDYEQLPQGVALQQFWLNSLGKAPRLILQALIQVWPTTLSKQEVAAVAGYEPGGGGFNNAVGRLRTLELIVGDSAALQASRDLFD